MSEAAEAGIQEAVRRAKSAAWLEENKSAIESYNRKIEKRGIAIPAAWTRS
jgi:antitoxin CcdA